MAAEYKEFQLNEVLEEFLSLFEECRIEYKKSGNNSGFVPTYILISKITSSVKLQCIADAAGGLEEIIRKMLCNLDGSIPRHFSEIAFIEKIKKYLESFCDELSGNDSAISDSSRNCDLKYSNNHLFKLVDRKNSSGISTSYVENYASDLIEDKKRLESLCTSLHDKIKNLERINTSLAFENNSLQLSFKDAARRESESDYVIFQLRDEIKKSEELSCSLAKRLADEEDSVKRERQKILELERLLEVQKSNYFFTKKDLSNMKGENQFLKENIVELEKQVDMFKIQKTSIEKNLQQCQLQILSLQEELAAAVKGKQELETQMKNKCQQLHQTTLLYEDLEMECKVLKYEINNKRSVSQTAKSTPKMFNIRKCKMLTSTPLVPKPNIIISHDQDSSDLSNLGSPVVELSSKVPFKSLRDEMEDEGEFLCDRVGCRSQSSSSQSEMAPEIVQKIEKQQNVISELVESITKQCLGSCNGNHTNKRKCGCGKQPNMKVVLSPINSHGNGKAEALSLPSTTSTSRSSEDVYGSVTDQSNRNDFLVDEFSECSTLSSISTNSITNYDFRNSNQAVSQYSPVAASASNSVKPLSVSKLNVAKSDIVNNNSSYNAIDSSVDELFTTANDIDFSDDDINESDKENDLPKFPQCPSLLSQSANKTHDGNQLDRLSYRRGVSFKTTLQCCTTKAATMPLQSSPTVNHTS